MTPAKPIIGQTVRRYRIVGTLGSGGMGVVFEAEDTRLPRRVALKFLPDELSKDPDAARRFEREARTIALVNHPNICTIYDVDDYDGRRFIAMERLEGTSLAQRMHRRRLGDHEIIDVAVQVALALEAAHEKGVVHRDIKPGNIFVSESGRVKVLDFGLARVFRRPIAKEAGLDDSTVVGRPLGTMNYMAPERILQLPPDPRSDLFSLGVVIYEMATGKLPFAGDSPSQTVTNILEKDPIPLSRLSPHRPKALRRAVDTLLVKRPDDRCQSAAQLRHALLVAKQTPRTSVMELIWRRIFGR